MGRALQRAIRRHLAASLASIGIGWIHGGASAVAEWVLQSAYRWWGWYLLAEEFSLEIEVSWIETHSGSDEAQALDGRMDDAGQASSVTVRSDMLGQKARADGAGTIQPAGPISMTRANSINVHPAELGPPRKLPLSTLRSLLLWRGLRQRLAQAARPAPGL